MRLEMCKGGWWRGVNLRWERACYWIGLRIENGDWSIGDYGSTLHRFRGDTLFNFGDE